MTIQKYFATQYFPAARTLLHHQRCYVLEPDYYIAKQNLHNEFLEARCKTPRKIEWKFGGCSMSEKTKSRIKEELEILGYEVDDSRSYWIISWEHLDKEEDESRDG